MLQLMFIKKFNKHFLQIVPRKLQINEISMSCRYHIVFNVEASYENILSGKKCFWALNNMEASLAQVQKLLKSLVAASWKQAQKKLQLLIW